MLTETKITDLVVEPRTVAIGEAIKITGKIKVHVPLMCFYLPGKGMNLELHVDGKKIMSTTSKEKGYFKFTWFPTEPGTHYIKVVYPGSALFHPSSSELVTVDVLTREEKEQRDLTMIAIGAGAVVILAFLFFLLKK